jgi:Secretion system C-terminal sorting domain
MKRILLLTVLLAYSVISFAQVSGGSFTASSCVTGDLNWTNPGTVNTIVIFAKAGSAVTVGTPTSNESTYTANAAFGSGTAYQNDVAAFCVYKSTTTATTAAITGLTPGVTYHFLAYNVIGTTYSTPHAFSGSTTALTNVTALTAMSDNGQIALSWANPSCFDEIMIVAKPTSTIAGTPTGDGTAYTPVADFSGAGTPFDATGKVVYKNNGTSGTVTVLTNGTTYFFRAFTRKGTTWSAGAEISAIPYDAVTAGAFNTNICLTTGRATWSNPGTVGTIILFAKAGSAINTTPPTNSISTYTADPDFSGAGTAYQHDAAAKCVYKGTGTLVNLTGLTAGTTYHFIAFNANGTSYSLPDAFNGATLTTPGNATGLNTTPAATSINFSWINASCFDEVLVVAKTSTISGTPTGDGTAYTANNDFTGGGTAFDVTGKVVYKGTGTSVNVIGLTTSTTYFFKIFTRKGTAWSGGTEVSDLTICTPIDVSALKISDANTTANLYWTDAACFDEVMIVAKQGTASVGSTITVAPTGNGSAYTAVANFSGGGTAFDGGKVVFKSSTNPGVGGFQTTNLTTGLIYTFKVFTRKGTTWSAGITITTVPGPPVLIASSFVPADGSSGVSTEQVFTATFNEKIYVSHTTASGTEDDVEFDPASGISQFIARGASAPALAITSKDLSLEVSGGLTELSVVYNILIGNKVLTDSTGNVSPAAGGVNDFAGTTAGTWNFTTAAGATITAPTVGTCVNQFTSLGNIVITEASNNNFQGTDNGSFSLVLGFDKTGYIFSPGTAGVTATVLPGGDIQSITVTSVTFTAATFTIQFANVSNDGQAKNDPDVITISGLKVSRDGSMAPPAIIFAAAATTLPIQGLTEGSTVLGNITGGTVPSAPTITYPAGDNSYCVNATFTGITITASDPDAPAETFNWYNDAALTVVNAINANSRTVAQLIGASPAPGTYTRYVTQVDGCESVAATVTIIVTSLPTASAGTNLTGASAVCSGATVTLGGSPTANGGTGSYTYAWTGPGSPAAVSNPALAMPDPGASDQTYNYQVTVTDGNSCSSTPATMQVEVKNLSENVIITQPNTFFYTTNNNPVDLAGSPAGGVFSGVGVLELSGSYKFDPEVAGIGTWPVTYSTTLTNGCSKSVQQNFDVGTPYDVFPALEDKYCNTEGTVSLAISPTILTEVQNYIDTWNSTYVPLYGYAPLKPTFTGIIRNEYETYYGDNNSVQGTTFYPTAFVTDQAYPAGGGTNGACATCSYAYIAIFIEFASPLNTYPYNYGPGDRGWFFNNGTTAALEYRGEFVNINPVPVVNFSGLLPSYCNLNIPYDLTGNKNGGIYEISDDNVTFDDIVGDGIKDATEGITAGLAEFNPQNAFGGATAATNKWIRYSVDPGTTGTTAYGGCIGRQTQSTTIYPATPVVFRTAVPANNEDFCYEDPSFNITVAALAGDPSFTTGVTFSGFGISDNGAGVGTFNPKTAFDQQNPSSTLPLTIAITATYTNSQGCAYSINRNFIVRPKPTSSFSVTDPTIPGTPPDLNFCYNDPTLTLLGNTGTSVRYEIDFISLGFLQTIPLNTTTFDPSVFYDAAVSQGGSNVSDATFNITYIVTDPIGCTASSTKLFAVSPLAQITISGINDGDKFCSNAQAFPVTFAPINGTLEINNVPTPLNPATNSISSANIPIGNAVTLEYEYRSGVSQCLTTALYTISKVDAPVASFATTAICDGDPATLTAGPDPDNYTWKWVLGDSVRSGTGNQSIDHIFPGLSQGSTQTSYLIRLIVENNSATALKVCRDSTEAIQVVGAYPQVDFNYADVCQNDFTRFTLNSNIPIATAEWDFGDGNALPAGSLTGPIPGGTHGGQTQGQYGTPQHKFSFTAGIPNRYDVELTGRTAAALGGCPSIITRQIAILEKLTPTRALPYNMATAAVGNEAGLWIEEDRSGASTWEFGSISGKTAMTNAAGNVWVTNASGPYNPNDNSFVNSPCFNLADFSKPVISLQYWSNSDNAKDGTILQYSTNGGASWQVVGTPTSGSNWYDNQTISAVPGGFSLFGWTGRFQQRWLTGKNSLDAVAQNTNVRFRIAFASDEREEFDGFAFNNVIIEERNRIMLVEHFSNVDTDNTAIALSTARFNTHAPLNDTEVVKIQYSTAFPDADPINEMNSEDHNARAAYYGLTSQSVPLGFIDGGRDEAAPFGFASPVNPDNGWWNDYKQKRSLSSSPYTLTVVSVPSGSPDELAIHVTGSKIGVVAGNKPVLQVAVIEKIVGGNQHVMRKLIPNAGGTTLDPLALTIDETFTWRAHDVDDLNQIAIVAFIQDEITKEIHQSDIDLNPTNKPTAVITGTEYPEYAKQVQVYPNPANHEVNIDLPAAVNKPTPIALYDAFGRVVYQSAFNAGEKTKTVSTSTFADGIYMLQLITPQGSKVVRKVMVTHR